MKMADCPSRVYIDGEPASEKVLQRRAMEGKDENAPAEPKKPRVFLSYKYRIANRLQEEAS